MSLNPPVRDWKGRRVWIIGASTGIGAATARLLQQKGARLALSARTEAALRTLAVSDDLVLPLDVTDAGALSAAAGVIENHWGGLDLVLHVAGAYSEMRADTFSLDKAGQMMAINVGGVLNTLAATLPVLLRQRHGGIGIVGSIAGYSGLPKALVYGPSKAAIINLCESLYLDLHPKGIAVHLISPGFVETPLTAQNDFPMPALMQPAEAAAALVRGIEAGDFDIHFPRRLSCVLKFLRLLPYRLYFALVRRGTGL